MEQEIAYLKGFFAEKDLEAKQVLRAVLQRLNQVEQIAAQVPELLVYKELVEEG
jgi:hypothetical protein